MVLTMAVPTADLWDDLKVASTVTWRAGWLAASMVVLKAQMKVAVSAVELVAWTAQ